MELGSSLGWRYALASVLGSSHVKSGDACQDASACSLYSRSMLGETLIAVAADGAGSAKKADIGSTEACQFVLRRVHATLDEGVPLREFSEDLAQTIIVEAQSHLREVAAELGATLRDLACTILVSVIGEDAAVFFQIGDGIMIVGPADEPLDEFSWVFWPERGEYANTTAFLTDPDVTDHLQHAAVLHRIDEVAVLTDGIQNLVLDYKEQTPHAPFFSRMMAPLRGCAMAGHAQSLSDALRAYLGSGAINDRTDDDKTLILASRRPFAKQ